MWIGCYGKQSFQPFDIDNVDHMMLTGPCFEFSDVKALVGELDFSFHAVSTRESLKSKSTMNIPGLSRASSFRDKTD